MALPPSAMSQTIGETVSLCPVCLRRVPASLERVGQDVVMRKHCPEHGSARAIIWRGPPDFEEWRAARQDVTSQTGVSELVNSPRAEVARGVAEDCPTRCGLCDAHQQATCCVLLEVTARCDLGCPVCFAASAADRGGDPPLAEIAAWLGHLDRVAPGCNVQLSGGEPTVRDDLLDILALCQSHGVAFIQLNTNGVRLAREPGYAERLAEAGLSTVFLQFDGVHEEPYRVLRGAPLLSLKLAAVERCAAAGLGVVLVPTLLPGVNTDQIGPVVDFALANLPAVRGVHFQPISYFGRVEGEVGGGDDRRCTLPEVVRAIVEQTEGRVPAAGFKPAACEHPSCSFRGEFMKLPNGRVVALGTATESTCAEPARGATAAEKAWRTAVRWTGSTTRARRCCCAPTAPSEAGPSVADSWGRIVEEMRGRTFSITGMAFQDAWTVDLERLRHCCLHVLSRDLRLVPFCVYNLTSVSGAHIRGAWRGRLDAVSRGAVAGGGSR